MHGIIAFLLRHGYWVLFANVLAEQAGLPIPAVPVMLAMGALAGLGNFSFAGALAVAICAALASDVMWFRLGRVRGHSILNLLCRISLEPDSCVSNIQTVFRRFGALALVFAKFVPGLNTAAAPIRQPAESAEELPVPLQGWPAENLHSRRRHQVHGGSAERFRYDCRLKTPDHRDRRRSQHGYRG